MICWNGLEQAQVDRPLGIAIVSLADTISTASAFTARTGQEIRGNQEMIGIGVANLAAGLFQGSPVSTSGSRTAVAERAGAKTQLTGVIGVALSILNVFRRAWRPYDTELGRVEGWPATTTCTLIRTLRTCPAWVREKTERYRLTSTLAPAEFTHGGVRTPQTVPRMISAETPGPSG